MGRFRLRVWVGRGLRIWRGFPLVQPSPPRSLSLIGLLSMAINYGPVLADIARQITTAQHHTTWRYGVYDPATGRLLHHGTTRRRPTGREAGKIGTSIAQRIVHPRLA